MFRKARRQHRKSAHVGVEFRRLDALTDWEFVAKCRKRGINGMDLAPKSWLRAPRQISLAAAAQTPSSTHQAMTDKANIARLEAPDCSPFV